MNTRQLSRYGEIFTTARQNGWEHEYRRYSGDHIFTRGDVRIATRISRANATVSGLWFNEHGGSPFAARNSVEVHRDKRTELLRLLTAPTA